MEVVRRDLHQTTANVSALLTKYAKLAQSASSSYNASGILKDDHQRRQHELEHEIDGALDTFAAQIERLSNFHATAQPPPSASATHALERHRDVLTDYKRDYSRTKASLREAEQRANLLGSVREEIRQGDTAFKSASQSSATDSLLAERGRIDNSHRMADETLSQAYATRAEFAAQRTAQVPALNSIIGMINSRRRRDSVIMGSVMAGCILFLLWYMFG
ncbi:protein transport protein gos1 [Microbotryomycetes sp. JL201]|nr:protein transport protein gos1 [Microbotryomycetes sp. JL201]